MKMKFRTALSLKNAFTGGLRIKLEDPLKIFLEYCDSLTEISPPSSLSSVEEIIWKITVTSGPGVSLHGNSEEILDMQISDTVCTRSDWRDFWMGVPKRIEFTKLFDIGDLYHHPTGKYFYLCRDSMYRDSLIELLEPGGFEHLISLNKRT